MNGEWIVRLRNGTDRTQVGTKTAELAALQAEGLRIPEGFAVTAAAYREFVALGRLRPRITEELRRYRRGRDLHVVAAEIRTAFQEVSFPVPMIAQILAAYDALGGKGTEVAVRCSPVGSVDGADRAFLHLRTGAEVLAACKRCFASLFNATALGDRELNGPDHLAATMPVTVQRMVRSDLGASGTARAESTFVRIHASWGLGAPADGDLYSFHPGPQPQIVLHRGGQRTKTVYAEPHGTRVVAITPDERVAAVLSDAEVAELGRWVVAADKYFRRPTELEWAKDGPNGHLYLVEARPWALPRTELVRPFRTTAVRVP